MEATLLLAKLPEAYSIFSPVVDIFARYPRIFPVVGFRLASLCGIQIRKQV